MAGRSATAAGPRLAELAGPAIEVRRGAGAELGGVGEGDDGLADELAGAAEAGASGGGGEAEDLGDLGGGEVLQ